MLTSQETNGLAKTVADKIWDSSQDKIFINQDCEKAIKDNFPRMSSLEVSDSIQQVVGKVIYSINKKMKHCKNQGISPQFEFNDYPPTVLIRYSIKHKEENLISVLRKYKRNIQATLNSMTWKSFEYLSKCLLKNNGVNPIELTNTNQEGIDFCGLFDIGQYTPPMIIPTNYRIRIIGQVKRYSAKVNPTLVRAFNTYCESVKHNEKDIIKELPTWFTASKSSVLGIYITTSDFTRHAVKYAEKEWMILRNGEQIIEGLIKFPDNKKWVSPDKNGGLTFNRELFLKSFGKQ